MAEAGIDWTPEDGSDDDDDDESEEEGSEGWNGYFDCYHSIWNTFSTLLT